MTMTQQEQHSSTYTPAPGEVVYDICAQAVGRVADPAAYSREALGRAVALVIPLTGSAPAWHAEPGCLRPATSEEIQAVLR
jgi:hypothetical protein